MSIAVSALEPPTGQADRSAERGRLRATMAFNGDAACSLLLGQRLIGEERWVT